MTVQGTATPPQVFIDTNLFVYILLGHIAALPRSLIAKTMLFFKDIENQKYHGTTSTFTETEYTGVWKQLMSKQRNQSVTASDVTQARQIYENFISLMGLEIQDTDKLIASSSPIDAFANVDQRVIDATPTLGKYDQKWHTLKGADGLTLILAERTGCTYVASADDDFKGIKSSVKPLNVREVY